MLAVKFEMRKLEPNTPWTIFRAVGCWMSCGKLALRCLKWECSYVAEHLVHLQEVEDAGVAGVGVQVCSSCTVASSLTLFCCGPESVSDWFVFLQNPKRCRGSTIHLLSISFGLLPRQLRP